LGGNTEREATMKVSKKFKISLWSGGRVVLSWITSHMPEPLASGSGYHFKTDDDHLQVEIMGTISIEEGNWEYEKVRPHL
jgi:hypothetical protein